MENRTFVVLTSPNKITSMEGKIEPLRHFTQGKNCKPTVGNFFHAKYDFAEVNGRDFDRINGFARYFL